MRKNTILSVFLFFAFSISAYAQQITGSVTDENGIPLPGASVIVEGTSNGVVTNFDGNYSIETSQGDVLVFRFVGYQTQSINVESSSAMNVQLIPNNALSEVVVTALGISREKKSLGYSVSEVSGESINDVKDDNIANSLIGKVAGLQITQSGGIGSGSRITIRGNNSLGGNTQALIVVDGVPINSSGINSGSNDDGGATFRSSISGGGISDINSDDVESISVLKGPTAAALYGSRAGNGVILVTTKKGTNSDKLGVTINTNISMDSPMFLPDYQNEYGQGTLGAAPTDITQLSRSSWGSRLDGSQKLYYNGSTIPYSAQENNVQDFFRNAIKSISSISLDKASEAGSIRFSYTNNSTESILENSDLNSHNFNLRGVANLSDKLSVDSKATYFTQEVNNRTFGGGEGILGYVYNMP
jgi:TonB-dependent SusC/RagA subfamily outer membrane receptor